jgi:hypothetical protein
MKSNEGSLVQRVESSYRQLSAVASDLNSVSDELGKSISELDSALKKLNLGITVWVAIRGGTSPDEMEFWGEDLGYGKVDGKWGIALRTVSGNQNYPDDDVEQWLFNDAPRSLRLSAIGKVPELLEKLSEEASETAKKIRGKLAETQEVAAVVKKVAGEPQKWGQRPITGARAIATSGPGEK